VAKSLCKLKKQLLKEDIEAYKALVANPEYLCSSCGRVAGKKKRLCEPKKL